LLRTLAKITDPTTGVREGEYDTFESAQGSLAKLGITLTKKMWDGTKLTDSARQAFVSELDNIYQQRASAYTSAVDYYGKQLSDAGLDPSLASFSYLAPTNNQEDSTLDSIDWGFDVEEDTLNNNVSELDNIFG
jgi:hypothetical protein